jgi:alkanesulfonate monooxygenase
MALRFHWYLPTNGDGRDIVDGERGATVGGGAFRPATLAYLGQIARSAEQLGFEGALTPTGSWCEDAWLTTAMLTEVTGIPRTRRGCRPAGSSRASTRT